MLSSRGNRLGGVTNLHPECTLENGEFGIQIQVQTTLKLVFLHATLSHPGKVDELNLPPRGTVQNGMANTGGVIESHLWGSKSDGKLRTCSLFEDTLPYPLKSKKKFSPSARNPSVQFHVNSHTYTSSLGAIPLKYTIGTFLITEVSWGKSREVYPFLFKTDKGRRRKGTLTFQ